jgi:hypothetical protein
MPHESDLASAIINVAIVEHIPVLRPLTALFLSEQAHEVGRLVSLLRRKKLFNLVIDLSGCEKISSEGLGIVASCWKWCQEKGTGYMGVVLPREAGNEVVSLFDITGLSRSIGSALQRSARDAVTYLKTFCTTRS